MRSILMIPQDQVRAAGRIMQEQYKMDIAKVFHVWMCWGGFFTGLLGRK